MFVRNTWYVAAFSGDVEPGKVLGRKYLNEPVVLYRTEDGEIAAVEDRCSHRLMPLSAGHVAGSNIRCRYHGVEFDGKGVCVRIPNQSRIPPQASIRSYPVVERDNIIWIWMGDAEKANADDIIANPEHNGGRWSWEPHYFHVRTNWQLLIDNIMDLTHLAYVHANSIGGNAEQHFNANMDVKYDGRRVELRRRMPDSVPPKTYVDAGGFKGKVDRWQEVDFEPGRSMLCRVNAGACDVNSGAYDGHRDHGFTLVNVHGITPETETTTHYIWSIATNAPPETGTPRILFDQILKTIQEDEEVLELQQGRIDDLPDTPFVGMVSDAAVNQARRLLTALHEAEESFPVAAE